MMDFKPRDIIIGVALIGCLVLKAMGKDGNVSMILTAIVGYAVGRRHDIYEVRKNGTKTKTRTRTRTKRG